MILWPLLYISLASSGAASQEIDNAIEEYCFSSSSQMKSVASRLKFILVPADKVQEESNCLTVSTPAHRRELIQNYVRRLEPNVSIKFSSAEIKKDPCHIKVERIKNVNSDTQAGGINTRLNPTANGTKVTQTSSEVSKIQTLKEFELTVNQSVVKGECKAINSTRYDITIEVRKDAAPLLPPVPPGTILVIPDAQIPKPQETSKLVTTLQLTQGEVIELGSVVKNLQNDGKKIDINSEATIEMTAGTSVEKVYLSID